MPPRRPKPTTKSNGARANGQHSAAQLEDSEPQHRQNVVPKPAEAGLGSVLSKHGEASTFEELLQHLHDAMRGLQDWGRQKGFVSHDCSCSSQVESVLTSGGSDATQVQGVLAHAALAAEAHAEESAVSAGAPEAHAEESAVSAGAPEAGPEGQAIPPPKADQELDACAPQDNWAGPKDLSPMDAQKTSVQLQLCDVWVSNPDDMHSQLVDTPHGRLRRLSSGTFFGNGCGPERAETEAWKTAIEKTQKKNKVAEVKHWASILILPPFSTKRAAWEVFGVALLMWDMFFIPFYTFEDQYGTLNQPIFRVLEIMSLVYWTLDVLASFCVGFYDSDGMVEMRPGHIAINYLKTWFCYDISCVTTDYLISCLQTARNMLFLLRGARMLRLIRVLKLHKRLSTSMRRIQSNQTLVILHIAKNMAIVLILNHMAACGWHWTGVNFPLSDDNWVKTWLMVDGDPEVERSLSYRYFTSLHWAITQMGVGAVEIHPKNSAERLYAVFVGMAALVVSSVLVSSVTTSMVQLQELHHKESVQDRALRQYLHTRGISQRLQGHIWAFVKKARHESKGCGIIEGDVEVIARLPSHMSLALRMEVYMPVIIHHPFFNKQFTEIGTGGSKGKTTRDLIGLMHEVRVQQEEDLFRTGDLAKQMQFVAEGEVLYKSRLDSCPKGTTVKKDEWLAEQVLWLKWVHVGRAVAMQVCEMFVIDSDRFQTTMVNERSAKLYALLFLQRVTSIAEPVTDVLGCQEANKSWQQEISLLAFNIRSAVTPPVGEEPHSPRSSS